MIANVSDQSFSLSHAAYVHIFEKYIPFKTNTEGILEDFCSFTSHG